MDCREKDNDCNVWVPICGCLVDFVAFGVILIQNKSCYTGADVLSSHYTTEVVSVTFHYGTH